MIHKYAQKGGCILILGNIQNLFRKTDETHECRGHATRSLHRH